ncbi:hypothetical protein [Arcobacter sp. F2176]|uniref:hypothetical protein n=1 Tax=Arcobacter sp. F2176 TaxID=2044511 RepID=UPI00100A5BA9|nr:hypothetical protein [Arcobacter sp. F2176]RXJ82160.1 hypothetical protein CRU95_04545 [Arcobacter sp. F2176]
MIKLNSPLTKTNILILSTIYIITIIFFFSIAFEQNINTFFEAVKIATNFILIPTLIGWYILKWSFEAILFLCKGGE